MAVLHDAEHHRFVITLDKGEAMLQYQERGDALDFYHVYVPPSHRGHGLAEQVTRAAFDYARQQNKHVIPTCPYISDAFLPRHPQYQDMAD